MNTAAPAALDAVLKHPGIWRRSASALHNVRALPTGLDELDALLPGGGWPCGALSEILFEYDGLGELNLLMPVLADLTQRRQRVVFVTPPYIPYAPALEAHGLDLRYVVQIEAAPAEGAWSAEQCLRSGACGAVLAWLFRDAGSVVRGAEAASPAPASSPDQRRLRHAPASGRTPAAQTETTYTQLRRLQLAAEGGDALAFLFRPAHAADQASPAALRLRLRIEDREEDSPSGSSRDVAIEILKCRGSLDLRSSRRTRLRRIA